MKKSKQLLGIGIVSLESGKIIGKITGTIFLPGMKNILGFTVESGKWVKKQKTLPVKNIAHIGNDKIMTKNDNSLIEYDKYPKFIDAVKEKDRVFSLIVLTNKGEELGYIDDIIIDEKSYNIEGYVLTDGVVEDTLKGKTIIPFAEEILFGENSIIINDSYKNIMLKNDISLKKYLKKSGD